MNNNPYTMLTDQMKQYAELSIKNSTINSELYAKYDVKRGLRDINGKGVVAGLTKISRVVSNKLVDGKTVPCEGELYYRGINVEDIINRCIKENRFGFEETAYLLMFGCLPSKQELDEFNSQLAYYRNLPRNFVKDIILKAPSNDMMNTLARSVLTMYAYDNNADDTSIPNVIRQCVQLIALFPLFSVYGYQAYSYYQGGNSLYIHAPNPELSTSENLLRLLRPDRSYTELEARILDVALILHAEHGGGNNSSFTTHVVTSSGTDTYSAVAAAIGSLKGPRHGGANIKVMEMFEDMKISIKDWKDEDEISSYLKKLLHKEAFDRSGLIYGMGHAVYSLSDPRAKILRSFVKSLSEEKNLTDEFELYSRVERLAPEIISSERKIYKGVSANVDFYSGFVYHMLDLPLELYTPIFAVSRIAGWSAHRIEELINMGKIIRPAYISVSDEK